MLILTATKRLIGDDEHSKKKGFKPTTDYNIMLKRYFRHQMEMMSQHSRLSLEHVEQPTKLFVTDKQKWKVSEMKDIYIATYKREKDYCSVSCNEFQESDDLYKDVTTILKEEPHRYKYQKYITNTNMTYFMHMFAPKYYTMFIDGKFHKDLLDNIYQYYLDKKIPCPIQQPPHPMYQLEDHLEDAFRDLGIIDINYKICNISLKHKEMSCPGGGKSHWLEYSYDLYTQYIYSYEQLKRVWG